MEANFLLYTATDDMPRLQAARGLTASWVEHALEQCCEITLTSVRVNREIMQT